MWKWPLRCLMQIYTLDETYRLQSVCGTNKYELSVNCHQLTLCRALYIALGLSGRGDIIGKLTLSALTMPQSNISHFLPFATHLPPICHPLQVNFIFENCDSNSRLVVDEDGNGKLRLERVNTDWESLISCQHGQVACRPNFHSLCVMCRRYKEEHLSLTLTALIYCRLS